MFGCIDIYSRRSWQLFSAKSVEDPSYDYQEEPARDVRQHGAPTARPFLPEHMLTLAKAPHRRRRRLRPLRVADVTRYSYKTSDKSNMHAASSNLCILTAAWAKAGTSRLTENYRSLARRWTSLNHKQ